MVISDDGDSADSASGSDESGEGWRTVKAKPRGARRGKAADTGASGSSSRGINAADPWGSHCAGFQSGPVGQRDRQALERKVFVQGLTLSTTSSLLRAAFRHCGRIEEARVVTQTDGTCRGFGFIEFADPGAAAMAARDGGVRIDGKLCFARLARPREELGAQQRDDADAADAKQEVRDYITRHELAGGVALALRRAEPKTALRVLRSIGSCGQDFSERLILVELQKVARTNITRELEARVSEWVADTRLPPEWKERVESLLLAQRSEEIEHILELGLNQRFRHELSLKENPSTWLLSQVQKFRRKETSAHIQVFCERFGFDHGTQRDLTELSAERARRLMQMWSPAAPGTQKQRQDDFFVLLSQALKESRQYKEERDRQVSAVVSHTRIIAEWSDEEEGPGADPNEGGPRHADDDDTLYAFDSFDSNWDAHSRGHRPGPAKNRPGSSTEQFVIHSASSPHGGGATRSQGTAHSGTAHSGTAHSGTATAARGRRSQPKPTHFVLCVDTSGSMVTADCQRPNGWTISRLEAVLDTCSQFISESAMNSEDIYSFVTFNEEADLHITCQHASEASRQLELLRPVAERQTYYAQGIRGIEAAIRRDARQRPAHVIFLSDGEPTDPSTYLSALENLRRRHPGSSLKIYTVGFGESAKVNSREGDFTYLQQLASLGRGHFQRCGASLDSLQGAFTAVTSTISHTRSTGRRSSAERDAFTGPPLSVSDTFDTQSSSQTWNAAGNTATGSMPPTINENLAEDDAASSDGQDDSCDDDPARLQQESQALAMPKGKAIEFELPHPAQIFKNVRSPELWKDFMAAQTSFKFDGHTFTRSAAVQRVFLRRKPFMQGGMRLVYGMVLEHGVNTPDAVEHMMCAKRLFQDLEKDRGFQAHAAFCKSTAVAHFYARQFRAATLKAVREVKFGFLDCQLYSPVGAGEDGYHFCGEAWLKGHFVKLNSNAGFVNETDYSEHSAIAQAFSHFTFDRSHGELLVVDLQGICGGEDNNEYSLLTDPQVHSRGAFERFGAGDLGEQGICAFFHKHRCGEFCQKLGLRKEYDLRAPTHSLQMPGVQDGIRHMLGSDVKEFFSQLRQNCRISSITMPREAHSEWLDIRMWATRSGGTRAEKMLQGRLEDFYEKARLIVPAQPRPQHWGLDRWKAALEAWKRESGAAIVAYPPDWKERGHPSEVWVFSECGGGGWWNHKNRSYAAQRIQESLELAQGEDLDSGGHAAEAPAQEESWRQYRDRSDAKYWYREPDGFWFWESDPTWQRFLDEACNCHWWWNKETGLWFYEP